MFKIISIYHNLLTELFDNEPLYVHELFSSGNEQNLVNYTHFSAIIYNL